MADNPADQEILERLIDEVKPDLPEAARNLHYLLATPFRYGFEKETRFRRSRERPGIFYGSESQETAIAETAYWQLRFFAAAPAARLPRGVREFYAFSVGVKTANALDLTANPFVTQKESWTDPSDYTACQAFASEARSIEATLIRYQSARDPGGGMNVALFDPSAFQQAVPTTEGTWHFNFVDGRLTAYAAFPSDARLDFTFPQFGLTKPTN